MTHPTTKYRLALTDDDLRELRETGTVHSVFRAENGDVVEVLLTHDPSDDESGFRVDGPLQ